MRNFDVSSPLTASPLSILVRCSAILFVACYQPISRIPAEVPKTVKYILYRLTRKLRRKGKRERRRRNPRNAEKGAGQAAVALGTVSV